MIRLLLRLLTLVVLVGLALVVLGYGQLLVWPAQKAADMAPTIPACDGRVVAEGFALKLRDPRPGEVVAIHAARGPDGRVIPDEDARDLVLVLRVAAGPGDVILGRDGSVFVDDVKFDDIATDPFPPVRLGGDQYYVLGDNRSAALDSRDFGPILRGAIFARALLVVWPLGEIGLLRDREVGDPPGTIDCS